MECLFGDGFFSRSRALGWILGEQIFGIPILSMFSLVASFCLFFFPLERVSTEQRYSHLEYLPTFEKPTTSPESKVFRHSAPISVGISMARVLRT